MAINSDILGMVWEYPDSFEVGREKVREFARSVKAEDPACLDEKAAAELGYDAIVAPPTFVTILGKLVQADFMRILRAVVLILQQRGGASQIDPAALRRHG